MRPRVLVGSPPTHPSSPGCLPAAAQSVTAPLRGRPRRGAGTAAQMKGTVGGSVGGSVGAASAADRSAAGSVGGGSVGGGSNEVVVAATVVVVVVR